jgi:hypothetical protein
MMAGLEGRKNRENMIRSMFSPATTAEVQAEILKMMLSAPEATAVGTIEATFEATSHENSVVNVTCKPIFRIWTTRRFGAPVIFLCWKSRRPPIVCSWLSWLNRVGRE